MLVPRFLMVVQMTVHCTISMLRFLLTLGFSNEQSVEFAVIFRQTRQIKYKYLYIYQDSGGAILLREFIISNVRSEKNENILKR